MNGNVINRGKFESDEESDEEPVILNAIITIVEETRHICSGDGKLEERSVGGN